LTGKYDHNLDAKGRLIVPAGIRKELGDACYVTLSFEHCLCIYSEEAWAAFQDKVNALPQTQTQGLRVLFANTARCDFDAQGRILVPQALRNFVGLGKNVTIIGFSNHAEIWDSDEYAEIEKKSLSLDNLAAIWKDLRI
jgi:MraZ protein